MKSRGAFLLGVALLFSEVATAQGREVLVYLSNEPAPTPRQAENAENIASWLKSSSIPADRILGDGILEDLSLFPAIVDENISAIRRNSERLRGVVVASNRLLQSGAVLVGRGGPLERVSLRPVPAMDERERSNPLSSAANLRLVLDLAGATFPTAEYEFVIVVESHGDELYAVTPRLGLPTEGLTKEALFQRVHGAESAFVERFGITTVRLLEILGEHRRDQGFRTKLVVLASCESTIETLPPEVPRALVASGGLPLPYGVIDFDKVLTSKEPTLEGAFVATLTPAPFELADPALVKRRQWRRQLDESLSMLPYFGPLVAWLAVFCWRRHVRARPASGGP